MVEVDYEKLKFKAGLEIHQQLDTSKLFCNCKSILRKDEPDYEICRRFHAVAGEGGEVDVAAKHEVLQDKEFIYQGYDTTCLVELDEEPPYEINKEALKIAVQISLLLNCKIIPITQIMRKTVIDGSNTSGFQRTVLIARDGFLETSKGKVRVSYVYLEEDAARIVERGENRVVYKLDRLGIPLVEIVTAPDVKDAEHAKEVALKIGETLRACKVRRGIGTIRQDVNISIKGGNRVEVKGMQDMKIFIKAIENEVKRQESSKVKMEVRNVLPDATTEFMRPLPGKARMYPETDLGLLKISKRLIDEVRNTLPKLRVDVEGELKKEGLNKEMISLLLKENKLEEFKELNIIINKPSLVAKVLLIFPREIASHKKIHLKKISRVLNSDVLAFVLEAVKDNNISENQIKQVLEKIVDGVEVKDAIKVEKVEDVEDEIRKIIKNKPGLSEKAYMGLVMKEFKGQVDGKEVMGIIRGLMK